ncbi:MAG: nicotinamide mononucleotide transporter family protein [Pseudomonadota bacterium]
MSPVDNGDCPAPLSGISHELGGLPLLEAVAVVLAVTYLALAVRQNRACFIAAFASTAIYVGLSFNVALPMHSALNVFYMGMAAYGWYSWRRDGAMPLPVTVWPWPVHAAAIAAIGGGGWLAAALLSPSFSPALPLLDSWTTLGAVWATLLLTRKELTHWLYWIVIDAGLVYMFVQSCLWLTAGLYVVYLAMIPFGIANWHRDWNRAAA